jgi:hypothetical protein
MHRITARAALIFFMVNPPQLLFNSKVNSLKDNVINSRFAGIGSPP